MASSETDRLNSDSISSDSSNTDKPYRIITVPMGHSNSYLITSGGRGILVDAGCAGKIKNRSGAKVLVHAEEKEYLEKGITPFPMGTMWFSKIVSGIGNTLVASKSRYQPLSPDIAVGGEYDLSKYIPSAKVIPTPRPYCWLDLPCD